MKQEKIYMKKLCSVMLHSTKAFIFRTIYSLNNTMNRAVHEKLNIRQELGLFVLNSILTLTKLEYVMSPDLGTKT